jgi:gluconate 2-dehydrogenase gamma chain
MKRRDVLKVLLAAPAATFTWSDAEAAQAATAAQTARAAAAAQPFVPKFFTAAEFRLVTVLADIIIPKDERSGSATDAGVPEFMDFLMLDRPVTGESDRTRRQTAMRGGLRWLDGECRRRVEKRFVDCTPAERIVVLDDIAWPERAKDNPALSNGVAFFSSFRDLTASGFWSSKIGVEDLQYIGNVANPNWEGCPAEALTHLGLKEA